jgi:hypothetical protein
MMHREAFAKALGELVAFAKTDGMSDRAIAETLQAAIEKFEWNMSAADRMTYVRKPQGLLQRLFGEH